MTETQALAAANTQALEKAKSITKTLMVPQTKAMAKSITATAVQSAVAEVATTAELTAAIPTMPMPPISPITPVIPPAGASDRVKRVYIKKSGGAIAWYQGQVRGKDRWDTIVHPYESNQHYLMVLGEPPEGATIVTRGKGAAYATAQVLHGKAPSKAVLVDSGFQDVRVIPIGKGKIKLEFTPDPKLETKGDITIGGRTPRISGRNPRISPRIPKLR